MTSVEEITELGDGYGHFYKSKSLTNYDKFLGKIIIDYHNSGSQIRRNYDGLAPELLAHEKLDHCFNIEDYQKYNN
ncbi:hypothetical protein EJ419_03870 [Alloscardovia theropitheci]|uniref:Uncharacterized protein n=1 Tax=Alloscardovia theropitheci TaxID=2496842 RepID=A0A4R0QS26_9BIFI|nr:hypothetical protein [Alloscardovia theropitheci]TCD54188.1 hypothetical protein EJ419_03870 [Alloscardovia theropitheci]